MLFICHIFTEKFSTVELALIMSIASLVSNGHSMWWVGLFPALYATTTISRLLNVHNNIGDFPNG